MLIVKHIFNLLIAGFLFLSCESTECCLPFSMNETNLFANPSVGKISQYVGISGTNYFDLEDQNSSATGDTLLLEVVALEEERFIIEERFTPNSKTLLRVRENGLLIDTVRQFSMIRRETGNEYSSEGDRNFDSFFFNLYPRTTIALSSDPEGRETCNSQGLKMQPCGRNIKVANWSLDENTIYEELFVLYDEMFLDRGGIAYSWMYNEAEGIPFVFNVNTNTGAWKAWKWIP